MENKTQSKTSAIRKTNQNPEVEKWMQELEDKSAGTDVSLHEYLEKALIILGEKPRRTGSGRNTGRSLRISSLETVLKHLFNFYQKRKNETNRDLNPAVLLLIARACYERSILILSRQDKVMVEKKKRIVLRGLEVVEKVKESNNKEALRLRGRLFLELEKIDKKDCNVSDLKKALSSAIQNGCTELDKNADDIEIALRYVEMDEGDKSLLAGVVESKLSVDVVKDIELKKSKAHFLLGNDSGVIRCMDTFTKQLISLGVPFSDFVWSEVAEFIRKIKEDISGKDYWKKLALLVWEACKKLERNSSSLDLLWYWGHLVTQYFIADFAFLAVDTVKEKAEIADFVKSRFQFHAQTLESEVGKIYETQASARQGKFIKELEKIYKIEYKKNLDANLRNIEDIGENWIVVHFYLCNYEKQGYALIFDADSKTWWEKPEKFSYTELFNKFLIWQTNYNLFGFGFPSAHIEKKKASEFLVELCRKIGDDMEFLFNIPDKKYVLFVPHSFLHLVPMHGTIRKKTNIKDPDIVFVENHPCAYLPAFSLAQKSNVVNSNEYIVFKKLSEGEEYFIKDAFPKWINDLAREVSPDDIRNIHSPPELLILICHGQADVANPFNSRLKLKDGDITHLDLLVAEKMNLKGSLVVLGACETDMAYPFSNVLDDHVSISTAFLIKGSMSVLGTMWITYFKHVGEILNKWIQNRNGTNLFLEVNKWQENRIKAWKRTKGSDVFYTTIVFRTIGIPM